MILDGLQEARDIVGGDVVVVVAEGDEIAVGHLHEGVAFLADGAGAVIEEDEDFDGAGGGALGDLLLDLLPEGPEVRVVTLGRGGDEDGESGGAHGTKGTEGLRD